MDSRSHSRSALHCPISLSPCKCRGLPCCRFPFVSRNFTSARTPSPSSVRLCRKVGNRNPVAWSTKMNRYFKPPKLGHGLFQMSQLHVRPGHSSGSRTGRGTACDEWRSVLVTCTDLAFIQEMHSTCESCEVLGLAETACQDALHPSCPFLIVFTTS